MMPSLLPPPAPTPAVAAPAGPAAAGSSADAPPIAVRPAMPALDKAAQLRAAAEAGRTAEIETLLAEGVPVDIADVDGETALMKSIEADRPDAAGVLHRHGASLSLKNRLGRSALDLVADKDDDALYKALGLQQ